MSKRNTMTVRPYLSVEVDLDAYAAEYGIDLDRVREDARDYIASAVHAEMGEFLRKVGGWGVVTSGEDDQ